MNNKKFWEEMEEIHNNSWKAVYGEIGGGVAKNLMITTWKPKDTITQIEGAVPSLKPIKLEQKKERFIGMDMTGFQQIAEYYQMGRRRTTEMVSCFLLDIEDASPYINLIERDENVTNLCVEITEDHVVEKKKQYRKGIRSYLNHGKKW